MAKKFNLPSLVGPKEKRFPPVLDICGVRCNLTKDAVRSETTVINRWEGDSGGIRLQAQVAYFHATGKENWHIMVWIRSPDVRLYGVGVSFEAAMSWLQRKMKEARVALKALREGSRV